MVQYSKDHEKSEDFIPVRVALRERPFDNDLSF